MSLSKNQINLIKNLQHAEGRAETGLCIVEGAKLINELLQQFGDEIHLYALETKISQISIPQGNAANITFITEKESARISALKNPPGILATVPLPKFRKEAGFSEKILWLDGIRDPGNMGTLIRTAEWFGYGEIWSTSDCAETFAPKVIQAAMGSAFRVPVYSLSESSIKRIRQARRLSVFGASMDGEDCRHIKVTPPFALIIGNEGRGISKDAAALVNRKISIPRDLQSHFPESLNAAVAASILMFNL